jgi:hypothetical protein
LEVIVKVLQDLDVLAENVYNMDETGVMILARWKQEWKNTRQTEKGKAYTTATQDRPKISYKMQLLAGTKRTQAAYTSTTTLQRRTGRNERQQCTTQVKDCS